MRYLGFLPDNIALLQIGLPGVLSLYFDCFTACMQAFIFSMLHHGVHVRRRTQQLT